MQQNGWHETHAFNDWAIFRKDEIGVRLLFVGADKRMSDAARRDWMDAKSHSKWPVAVALYRAPSGEDLELAENAGILLCNYTALNDIEVYCRSQLAAVPETYTFKGAIESFEPPSTLAGWVTLAGPESLIHGPTVSIMRNNIEIASVQPHLPRPDVSNDDTYQAGYRAVAPDLIDAHDLLTGRVEVVASIHDDFRHTLQMTSKLRARLAPMAADASMHGLGDSAIGKLIRGD